MGGSFAWGTSRLAQRDAQSSFLVVPLVALEAFKFARLLPRPARVFFPQRDPQPVSPSHSPSPTSDRWRCRASPVSPLVAPPRGVFVSSPAPPSARERSRSSSCGRLAARRRAVRARQARCWSLADGVIHPGGLHVRHLGAGGPHVWPPRRLLRPSPICSVSGLSRLLVRLFFVPRLGPSIGSPFRVSPVVCYSNLQSHRHTCRAVRLCPVKSTAATPC